MSGKQRSCAFDFTYAKSSFSYIAAQINEARSFFFVVKLLEDFSKY